MKRAVAWLIILSPICFAAYQLISELGLLEFLEGVAMFIGIGILIGLFFWAQHNL